MRSPGHNLVAQKLQTKGTILDTTDCAHCSGTGKEFQRISLSTLEPEYQTCHVCNGTAFVSADRRLFTEWVDKSLENARELLRQRGNPVEICIAGHQDLRMTFDDGATFILGGFTVGYRGTGPEYTERLLSEAGFCITLDDIERMRTPISLTAGKRYIAPCEKVFEAESLDQARRIAVGHLPPDAKLLSLETICDGEQQEVVGTGRTPENALTWAQRELPKHATVVQTAYSHGLTVEYEGSGKNERAALEAITSTYFVGPEVSRLVNQPESHGTVSVYLYGSAEEAISEAKLRIPSNATVNAARCKLEMHKGVFGFGKHPARYEVDWSVDCSVRATFKIERVTLQYVLKPTVRLRYLPRS